MCSLHALPRSNLVSLLRGVRVGVLGDSVARLFYAALLRAMGLSPEQRVVTGHRSFTHSLASGAHGSFVWAPYGENISAALRGWHAAGTAPDIVVAGASLWQMLHVGDGAEYAASLRDVREAMELLRDGGPPASASRAQGAARRRSALPPLFFWMSTTALVTPKLLTEEKRARLTPEAVAAYDALARQERLQLPGGPCVPLDVHRITHGACAGLATPKRASCSGVCSHSPPHPAADCGPECTADGMHFINATYDALVQQWANGVRLMWRAAYCTSRGERRALRWRSGTSVAALCQPPAVHLLPAEPRRRARAM